MRQYGEATITRSRITRESGLGERTEHQDQLGEDDRPKGNQEGEDTDTENTPRRLSAIIWGKRQDFL